MPSYSGADNAKGVAAYKAGMPGVTVVPINSDRSIRSGGSIHCVTQTIPFTNNIKKSEKKNSPLQIESTTLKTEPQDFFEKMIINWDTLIGNN